MSIAAHHSPAIPGMQPAGNARVNRTILAAILAAAVVPSMPAAAGDGERGSVLAAPCASCHGTDGQSPGEIPSIGRTGAADMTQALLAFRDGTREATVMNRIARGYEVPEIEAIAAYFAEKGE